MLLINSIMLTVLPTPAPPNRPTLPPLANGHIRSMTLMPVSSRSLAEDWSSYDGAARWISQVSEACTGPASSIGLPSTSMMRPRVPVPTGTAMPRPVLVATRLRLRPSVEPSAIERTTPSPSCCCTSSVISVFSTFSASYTLGTASRGNSTSTTAPMIWTILPWLILVSSDSLMLLCWSGAAHCRKPAPAWMGSDRGGAAHDLGNFLGDRRLAGLVVDQLQVVDQLVGVVGGGLHRHHARGMLGGDVLQHRLVHQRLDVARQHVVEHRRRVRLVQVVPVMRGDRLVRRRQRQQLVEGRPLRHRVDEIVVAEVDPVQLAGGIAVEHGADHADQLLQLRGVAEVADRGPDV